MPENAERFATHGGTIEKRNEGKRRGGDYRPLTNVNEAVTARNHKRTQRTANKADNKYNLITREKLGDPDGNEGLHNRRNMLDATDGMAYGTAGESDDGQDGRDDDGLLEGSGDYSTSLWGARGTVMRRRKRARKNARE